MYVWTWFTKIRLPVCCVGFYCLGLRTTSSCMFTRCIYIHLAKIWTHALSICQSLSACAYFVRSTLILIIGLRTSNNFQEVGYISCQPASTTHLLPPHTLINNEVFSLRRRSPGACYIIHRPIGCFRGSPHRLCLPKRCFNGRTTLLPGHAGPRGRKQRW